MLLPTMNGNLQHVTDFLMEAKMTATMEHPHIVSFVGVAWESLSDLCVVLEFMEGGELRTLLDGFVVSNHPMGFDRQKASIALQVCHALTYLHSLKPPVIHRDLKSRNVLLNSDMVAKLSDFGISRERLDRTMTAGVGTSLWMAPEVMLGERYDDKADMFSFGVVLSELDVHTFPYAHVKKEMLDSNGREMADSMLLAKVIVGVVKKATIALQVCHAPTYLYSLTPPVIHRDLKSRNTLLNNDVQAKLSGFGISREHLNRTMTAGVGTSLWMALDVMLGERHDHKVDIFSFGVVLSDMDVHTLPYAWIKVHVRLWYSGVDVCRSILPNAQVQRKH
ncbi:hypothetical protein JM16_006530, partial [Phytophthora kernoviae]